MIFSTVERITKAYSWNTGEKMKLESDVCLSDYTGLEEEVDEATLKKTLVRVHAVNADAILQTPALMMVTTGVYKSCRVWIDQSVLKKRPEINDPKKEFDYYSEV